MTAVRPVDGGVPPHGEASHDARDRAKRGKQDLVGLGLFGAFWLAVARWLVRLAHIITVVLLARLLMPAEYGLVALAKVVANIVLVGNFGLQAAVIQKPGEVDEHTLDVAWTYDKLLLNLVLAASVFFSAPFVADFFDVPEMRNVVRALALVPIAQGLENNAIIILTRQLEYRRRFWLEAVNGLGMLVLVVPLAFLWKSVWAFVVAYIFGLTLRALLSYVMYPRLPRIRLDPAKFRELFGFGRWMIGLKLVTSAREQAAPLVLGKVLGPALLGFFHIGARFSAQLSADLDQTARKVLFPIYSKVQSDVERLARGYGKAIELTWFLIGPFSAVLAVLATPATLVVFGEKWLPAVPLVQVLSFAGVVKTTTNSLHPLLRGRGLPRIEFALNLLYALTILPLLILAATRWGVIGAAWSVVVAELIQIPIWLWLTKRHVGLGPAALIRAALLPFVLSALCGGAAYGAASVAAGLSPVVELLAGGSAAGVVLLVAVFVGGRHLRLRGLDILADRLAPILARVFGRRR